MASQSLVLGSASPRRADLLDGLGVTFTVATVDIDEGRLVRADDALGSVSAIAHAKFEAFGPDVGADQLLTADTLVACAGQIMGKPGSDAELVAMLQAMSGQTITVLTALCIGTPGSQPTVDTVTTTVHLRPLTTADVEAYVATGAGNDKAAGLALQTEAAPFIDVVDGCWSNVLGLPICAVAAALRLPGGGTQAQRCSLDLCSVDLGR